MNPSIIGKVVLDDEETVSYEDSEEEVAAIEVLVTANDTNPVNKEDEVKEISDEAESDKE